MIVYKIEPLKLSPNCDLSTGVKLFNLYDLEGLPIWNELRIKDPSLLTNDEISLIESEYEKHFPKYSLGWPDTETLIKEGLYSINTINANKDV